MKKQSRTVFEGYGYVAAIAGFQAIGGPFLSVTRDGKGKYLQGQQAVEWCEAIETAIDNKEAAALCRHIYKDD